jgi:iron complex outermembrane receptor protein
MTWRSQLHSSARIPSIDEQFMNGAAPSFPILGVGSSTIGIERSWGGESTLAYDGDWLFLEAAGYASFIDDYIYFVPQPQQGQCAPLSCTTRGPLPVFAFTPTDALFGGGELRFDVKAPRLPLSIAGSASWVRGQNLVDREPLALVPADRYVATGRYHLPESRVSSRAYLELGGTLVARQRRTPLEIEFAPPPPLYFLLGAGAGAEFATERRVVRLSVVGNNLLNQRYRDYTSLLRYFADEAGWSVQLRLSIDLDVELGESSGEVAQRRRRGRLGSSRQRG